MSVGMIRNPIYGRNKSVPNHQPVMGFNAIYQDFTGFYGDLPGFHGILPGFHWDFIGISPGFPLGV